jgi:hypothetical protein
MILDKESLFHLYSEKAAFAYYKYLSTYFKAKSVSFLVSDCKMEYDTLSSNSPILSGLVLFIILSRFTTSNNDNCFLN